MKQLEEPQLTAFDTDYVTEALWAIFVSRINADFPSGAFRFIDMGGGNGRFADRLLGAFPRARGIVLDNAQVLLDKNTADPRKELILGGIEEAPLSDKGPFDVICFNWSLHHLVVDGYAATRRLVDAALGAARGSLSPTGRISVFENLYDGLLFDAAPGRLIFSLTSSKRLAPLIRRGGANTAGVGVCFRSRSAWLDVFDDNELAVIGTGEDAPWPLALKRRVLLHMGSVRCGHFWLASR